MDNSLLNLISDTRSVWANVAIVLGFVLLLSALIVLAASLLLTAIYKIIWSRLSSSRKAEMGIVSYILTGLTLALAFPLYGILDILSSCAFNYACILGDSGNSIEPYLAYGLDKSIPTMLFVAVSAGTFAVMGIFVANRIRFVLAGKYSNIDEAFTDLRLGKGKFRFPLATGLVTALAAVVGTTTPNLQSLLALFLALSVPIIQVAEENRISAHNKAQ